VWTRSGESHPDRAVETQDSLAEPVSTCAATEIESERHRTGLDEPRAMRRATEPCTTSVVTQVARTGHRWRCGTRVALCPFVIFRRNVMGKIIDKVKGKLMKAEGKVTGDKLRQAQGSAVDTKGDIKGAVSRVKNKARAGVNKMKRKAGAARRTR
jgi:uncharacterized protein YjbJ (UPF0337 family)